MYWPNALVLLPKQLKAANRSKIITKSLAVYFMFIGYLPNLSRIKITSVEFLAHRIYSMKSCETTEM